MSATPELDRQKQIIDSGQAETIQRFIEWLFDEQRYVLARYETSPYTGNEILHDATPSSRERLMAAHFSIDLEKIERERRMLLDEIRERQHER